MRPASGERLLISSRRLTTRQVQGLSSPRFDRDEEMLQASEAVKTSPMRVRLNLEKTGNAVEACFAWGLLIERYRPVLGAVRLR